MPVTTEAAAPYAPASVIIELIERHRNKGLPPVVDADVLLRAGVSDSLVPRTLQALRTLDLLTDDGRPSQVFEGLRLAPSAEYKQRLAEWLTATYADALSYVNPATDDEVAIRDAFRKYIPTGQQGRMVTLFMGLFTEAGVIAPRQKQAPQAKAPVKSGTGQRVFKVKTFSPKPNQFHPAAPSTALPPALAGLLASLPKEGAGWTQDRRDKFVTTFGAVVDFCFPIVQPAAENENGD